MSDAAVSREEFEALKAELAELRAQLARLAPAPGAPLVEPGIPEEIVPVIAAAVAAFLGKRATIRIIRRVHDESGVWRQQGRATVTASHKMPSVRGW